MKIIRNILIGFGAIFVLIIGLVIFLGIDSTEFKEKQAPYIEQFMGEFSTTWNVSSVYDKLTNDLLLQIESPNSKHALGVFQSLGEFEDMSDLTLKLYNSGTTGKTGTFTFKAHFTNGPALVEMILIENDGKTLVNGLHITPVDNIPAASTKHEA